MTVMVGKKKASMLGVEPTYTHFAPLNGEGQRGVTELTMEEYETIRLPNAENLAQAQCNNE